MSFRAKKIRFWWILASFLGVSFKSTCAGLNSFFSTLYTAYSFSTTRKTFGKKATSKPQAGEFFLCPVHKFFNSTEFFPRVNESLRLISYVRPVFIQ